MITPQNFTDYEMNLSGDSRIGEAQAEIEKRVDLFLLTKDRAQVYNTGVLVPAAVITETAARYGFDMDDLRELEKGVLRRYREYWDVEFEILACDCSGYLFKPRVVN